MLCFPSISFFWICKRLKLLPNTNLISELKDSSHILIGHSNNKYLILKNSRLIIALRYADVIIMQKIRCKALWDRYGDKYSKQNGIFTGASSRKQTLYIEIRWSSQCKVVEKTRKMCCWRAQEVVRVPLLE